MFNLYEYNAPLTLHYSVNGHAYTQAWPFPTTNGFTSRSVSIDLNKADLVNGPQFISLWADQAIIAMNFNVVLVNAGGTPSPTATATATATPTATPSPTATATAIPDVCTQAYYKNGILTSGPVITCP